MLRLLRSLFGCSVAPTVAKPASYTISLDHRTHDITASVMPDDPRDFIIQSIPRRPSATRRLSYNRCRTFANEADALAFIDTFTAADADAGGIVACHKLGDQTPTNWIVEWPSAEPKQ